MVQAMCQKEKRVINMFGRNQNEQNNAIAARGNTDIDKQRPPLEWREIKKFQHGFAIGAINSATRSDGTKIYSWSLGKEGRRDDRVMKFLDVRDIENSHGVLDDVQDYIEDEQAADRDEQKYRTT